MVVHLATFSNGVSVYVEAGQTFVRAIDVGRALGLSSRKVRKWTAELAEHVSGVSKRRVPCGNGSPQMTVTLGHEAALALAHTYDDLELDIIWFGMRCYDLGFAQGQLRAETDHINYLSDMLDRNRTEAAA